MSGAGTTMSMIRTIESNNKLLNRTNMFAQLRNINHKSDQKYTYIPIPKEALASMRLKERSQLKSSLLKKRIIGVLVIIPTSIILMAGIYLFAQALM